jgi:opacity protein-like surface antigen
MKNLIKLALIALIGICFTSQDLIAQKGVYIGIKLAGTAAAFDDFETDDTKGGGLEFDLGYNFSNNFGIFSTLGGYRLDNSDVTLGYFDVGGRYFFGTSSIKPYLDLALTASTFKDESQTIDRSLSGTGLSGGGGVQFFFTEKVALNLGLLVSRINYREVKYGNITIDDLEFKATNTRAKLGLAFYF